MEKNADFTHLAHSLQDPSPDTLGNSSGRPSSCTRSGKVCHFLSGYLWVSYPSDRKRQERGPLRLAACHRLSTQPFPYSTESKEEDTPLKLKCELCGRVDFAYKFKRSKRFCSMACAKR